ncbi:MAG: Hsp20/alpha crystallin family protein [Alphaproteobacteria bacterium]
MVAAKRPASPKRPSAAPKRPKGGASAAPKRPAGGAKSKAGGADPQFSGGANFSDAISGASAGVNNLFGFLGDLVGQLSDLAEKAEKAGQGGQGGFTKEGEFNVQGLGEKARGIYGVSVKMGLGGEPAVQTFGNIHPTKKGPEVSDVREPLVDVFDEDGEVLVIAEMPGVAEKDITVKVSGETLKLTTKGEFHYSKEVELPAKVKARSIRKTYRNGLLEMRLTKA